MTSYNKTNICSPADSSAVMFKFSLRHNCHDWRKHSEKTTEKGYLIGCTAGMYCILLHVFFYLLLIPSVLCDFSLLSFPLCSKRGFDVRSFGTGSHVKLPGPAPDKPNVYDFKTTYEQMYNDLVRKDKELYPLLTPFSSHNMRI